jgi:LysM repeat protein
MKTTQTKLNRDGTHHGKVNQESRTFFSGRLNDTGSFFSPVTVQPKLKIGAPDDPCERQADRVAEAVVSSPAPAIQQQSEENSGEILQRKCTECEKDEGLQMKSSAGKSAGAAPPGISQKIQNAAGGTQLPASVKSEMSQKIGADFSDVNIHTGPEASLLNQSLGARAFTHGNHIFFNSGEYNPDSREGKRLLAHELTHVVQQVRSNSFYKVIQKQDMGMSTSQARSDPPYGWDSAYSLEISGTDVIITVRANINPDAGVTAAEIEQTKENTRREFRRYFDQRFTLQSSDGNSYMLHVDIEYVDSGEDLVINLHSGAGHDNLSNWFVASNPIDRAHEMGHQIGLLDEYVDAATTSRATNASPGVQTDNSIMGNYYNEGIRDADVRERHGTQLATDITNATGRNFTANWSDTYVVRQGDNLSWIARRIYGDETRADDIYNLNRRIISDPNRIYPGQELELPPR